MYWQVDYGQVYDVIQHDLGDLQSFAGSIANLL